MENMNISEATRIVKEVQDEFMRGGLDPDMIQRINAEYPQAIPDWTKMKVNLKIRLKKFRKRVNDVFRSGLAKAYGCKRFRPGKETSTQKKELKQFRKLENQYNKSGCTALMSFRDLMEEVKVTKL
jgi:hypothetical protein